MYSHFLNKRVNLPPDVRLRDLKYHKFPFSLHFIIHIISYSTLSWFGKPLRTIFCHQNAIVRLKSHLNELAKVKQTHLSGCWHLTAHDEMMNSGRHHQGSLCFTMFQCYVRTFLGQFQGLFFICEVDSRPFLLHHWYDLYSSEILNWQWRNSPMSSLVIYEALQYRCTTGKTTSIQVLKWFCTWYLSHHVVKPIINLTIL